MPQNEHMERHAKLFGRRFDAEQRERKREARSVHKLSHAAQHTKGLKAKMLNKKRYNEKVTMKKTLNMNSEKKEKQQSTDSITANAKPIYLLDRTDTNTAKTLSNSIKQKKKDKVGKWSVPIEKVKSITEDEIFKVIKTGQKKKNMWKRMITKNTFVGSNFTRKPVKYERFIRPRALRITKAHVTHPDLKVTFCLDVLGVKKNPHSALYSNLGVLTKGTIIEVNVSDLGLVTPNGKVVWGKYAQITNHPENDGCCNAVLLV